MQAEIRLDLRSLEEEAKADGTSAIIQDITERITQGGNAESFYFLSDASGHKLAGNLNAITPYEGWRESSVDDPANQMFSDDDHRLWAQGTRLPDGSFLLVGQDAFRLLATQETIVSTFAWTGGLAFLVAVLAGLLVSRGFLRRIDDINQTSLAIMDGQLKQRIAVRGTSDEIDRLSLNLNKLFDSNQALLESLKQVSSNIAHDLRTPLSRLRQGLEEARLSPQSKTKMNQAIDRAVDESDQLLTIFAALLRITQIESGTRKAGFRQVDLTSLFQRVDDAYRAVVEEQDKTLTISLAPNLHVVGDRELLLQMLVNLTENAIRHTPKATAITLELKPHASGIMAVISDTGPGIPEDQRSKVFDHFYRLDTARSTPGSGLGLSLVAAIAKLHDLDLQLQDNHPGLKVCILFPQPQTTFLSSTIPMEATPLLPNSTPANGPPWQK
jgi:signal transduction histidine kinase